MPPIATKNAGKLHRLTPWIDGYCPVSRHQYWVVAIFTKEFVEIFKGCLDISLSLKKRECNSLVFAWLLICVLGYKCLLTILSCLTPFHVQFCYFVHTTHFTASEDLILFAREMKCTDKGESNQTDSHSGLCAACQNRIHSLCRRCAFC